MKNHRNSVLLENIPGLTPGSSDDEDDDDDDTSGAAEKLNEAAGADDVVERRPWRERRMKSLLHSIKSRVSGDRIDDNTLPRREHVSLVAGNVTLDVLKHLLPNLSTRPVSTADPTHTPKLSRTLQRQRCLRQQKADCGLDKNRAKTAPCGFEGPFNIFTFGEDFSAGVKSASSTPNLMYPEDVNVMPSFFRGRSQDLSRKDYRRANSAQ